MSWHLENSLYDGLWALIYLVGLGGLGLYLAWAVAATIYDGTRAKSWVQVPAQVVHVEFARATYRYEWQGRKLVGDRAGASVFRFASELDDWDLRMEAMITEAQEKEKPIMVFVNPSNPAESMINNEIRWATLVMFGFFSTALCAGGMFGGYWCGRRALGRRSPRQEREAAAARYQAGGGLLAKWFIAVLSNAAAIPVAIMVIPIFWADKAWPGVVLLAIFVLVGLGFLYSAISKTAEAIRGARSSQEAPTR